MVEWKREANSSWLWAVSCKKTAGLVVQAVAFIKHMDSNKVWMIPLSLPQSLKTGLKEKLLASLPHIWEVLYSSLDPATSYLHSDYLLFWSAML